MLQLAGGGDGDRLPPDDHHHQPAHLLHLPHHLDLHVPLLQPQATQGINEFDNIAQGVVWSAHQSYQTPEGTYVCIRVGQLVERVHFQKPN